MNGADGCGGIIALVSVVFILRVLVFAAGGPLYFAGFVVWIAWMVWLWKLGHPQNGGDT